MTSKQDTAWSVILGAMGGVFIGSAITHMWRVGVSFVGVATLVLGIVVVVLMAGEKRT